MRVTFTLASDFGKSLSRFLVVITIRHFETPGLGPARPHAKVSKRRGLYPRDLGGAASVLPRGPGRSILIPRVVAVLDASWQGSAVLGVKGGSSRWVNPRKAVARWANEFPRTCDRDRGMFPEGSGSGSQQQSATTQQPGIQWIL